MGNNHHAGPSRAVRPIVERGPHGWVKRKHPIPSIGDRFSELTVSGFEYAIRGGIKAIRVRCSCGAREHSTSIAHLYNRRSTRCNVCAKKQSGRWRKNFFKYSKIVPDDGHRRRLLNRLSACKNRCHNPNDRGYPNYGGRGIHLYAEWHKNKCAFLSYVITLPGWDDPILELDRIDVNKGYEPGN